MRRFKLALTCTLAGLSAALAGAPSAGAEPLPLISDLDGLYLALGPVGSAVHSEAAWNGAFGGEISLMRVTERQPVTATGIAIGAMRFSDRKAGHLWADLLVARRLESLPFDPVVGLSVGPSVEVDEVVRPRFGAHGTLWVFAGVIPYLRLGAVQKSGLFVELGIKVALPALRL